MIRKFELLLVIFGMIVSVNAVVAQDYQVMPINDSFNLEKIKAEPEANGDEKRAMSILRQRISRQQSNASNIFRDGGINSQFQNYYKEVVVPELTRYDVQSLATLTDKHHKIIKDLATRVRNNTVRAYLIKDVFFPMLGQIVDGNYHPAVRYNAILTIGKLDEVVGKQRIAAPRAYRDSLPYLLKKYTDFADPKLAYMKYGAFKGIARIAGLEFQKNGSTSGDAAKPILTALLGAKPAGLPDDLFKSMQKTAVQTLGLTGDPSNADAYASLIKDEKVSIWTRAEAAVAFSKIKAATFDSAKVEAVADSMAKLMHDVLRQEAKSLTDYQKRIAILAARKKELVSGPKTGGGLGSGAGGMGAGKGDPGAGREGDLMAGGGGTPGGSGGSTPGGAPTSGGAGASSGRSSGGSSGSSRRGGGDTELKAVPAYRIEIARRRIKTIALGMVSAFGETSGSTGILRWANSDAALLTKLSSLKTLMKNADEAAETGLSPETELVENLTSAMRAEFIRVAKKIANALGNAAPAKGTADAGKKKGKGGSGDSFLNN